jgi:hypothetical protein
MDAPELRAMVDGDDQGRWPTFFATVAGGLCHRESGRAGAFDSQGPAKKGSWAPEYPIVLAADNVEKHTSKTGCDEPWP